MNEQQHKEFERLMDGLEQLPVPVDPASSVPEEIGDPTIRSLLFALLRFDATESQALHAIARIRTAVVDLNELRIAYPDEIAVILGPRYPKVLERSERIRAVLCDLFNREHEISIASLYEKTKREARTYLEGLEGITPYVAHRVALTMFAVHCVPMDSRLNSALLSGGIINPGTPPCDTAGSLERVIRASDSLNTFLRLEAWVENGAAAPGRSTTKTTKKPGEPRPQPSKGR